MATKVRDRIIIQTEPVAVKIEEAAALIGVGETTLRKWIDKLGFPCVRAGGADCHPDGQDARLDK